MDFTERELTLLSDGCLALIDGACKAKIFNSPEVWDAIENYIKELQTLNIKICNYMEG